MGVTIQGMDRLRRKLGVLTDAERDATKREVKRAALNVQNGAKLRAPVGTPESTGQPGYVGGRLRNSITHEERDAGFAAVVGTNVVYARRVEFGFKGADVLGRVYNQRPQPFLFPAFEEERPKFLRRLRKALDDANRKASR